MPDMRTGRRIGARGSTTAHAMKKCGPALSAAVLLREGTGRRARPEGGRRDIAGNAMGAGCRRLGGTGLGHWQRDGGGKQRMGRDGARPAEGALIVAAVKGMDGPLAAAGSRLRGYARAGCDAGIGQVEMVRRQHKLEQQHERGERGHSVL
jgi:hypothetical protein